MHNHDLTDPRRRFQKDQPYIPISSEKSNFKNSNLGEKPHPTSLHCRTTSNSASRGELPRTSSAVLLRAPVAPHRRSSASSSTAPHRADPLPQLQGPCPLSRARALPCRGRRELSTGRDKGEGRDRRYGRREGIRIKSEGEKTCGRSDDPL